MKYFVEFQRDQRGVSPVIGVILMVAITVVMGAVGSRVRLWIPR